MILFSFAQIVRPANSFLVVDVQNDFISGSLDIRGCSAQQNGLEVMPSLLQLALFKLDCEISLPRSLIR